MTIVNLEFYNNVEGMRCDLNSIIDPCNNWPEGTEENLSEGSQSPDGYLNVKNFAQKKKF